MDVADKIITGIVVVAFVAFGIPLVFGFFNNGNFTLKIGTTTFDTTNLIILIAVIFVLGTVYLVWKHMKL